MKTAYIIMFVAEIFFAAMVAFVKAASGGASLPMIIFFRSLVSVIIMGLLMIKNNISFIPNNIKLTSLRGLFGSTSLICNFYGISHLHLGDASMLLNTFPLFVVIFSVIILKEVITKQLITYICIAFIGIVLILNPDFNLNPHASLIALLGAVLAGLDIVTIRGASRFDHFLLLVFYFSFAACLISLPIILQETHWPTSEHFMYILGAGLCGTIAQGCITKAFGMGDVSRLAPMAYLSVVFSYMTGMFIWNEIPQWITYIGCLVVIISCIKIIRLEFKLHATP